MKLLVVIGLVFVIYTVSTAFGADDKVNIHRMIDLINLFVFL
jgi:hypothetical protein